MKIVMIGPVYPYRGGIAHFTTELVQAMVEEGHQVEVISFKRQYPRFLYPGKSDKDPSKNPTVIPAKFILDPLYPWTWIKTCKEIRNLAPDLVVFQWWTTFWAPAFGMLARWLKCRNTQIRFLIHNVYPHEARGIDKILTKIVLSPIDHFIVMSANQKKLLNSLLHNRQIELVPHPNYYPKNQQIIDKKAARKLLNISMDRKVVLFFGLIRPYKGLNLLIEAIGLLKRKGDPIHVLIAGEFWDSIEEYEKLISKEEIENLVTIDNRYIPDEEVDIYFVASDLLVAPYVGGTQSGSVNLALGYGIQVLASESLNPSVSSYDKNLIRIFSPTNAEALANSIHNWLNSIGGNHLKPKNLLPTQDWHHFVEVLCKNYKLDQH